MNKVSKIFLTHCVKIDCHYINKKTSFLTRFWIFTFLILQQKLYGNL